MNDRNLIILLAASATLAASFQIFAEHFIYFRPIIFDQPWRLWTAHWVHVGWIHYFLNLIAFLCFPFIFPKIRPVFFIMMMLIIPVLSSLTFYYLYPQIEAYAGFSGVLHGLYASAAVLSLKLRSERPFASIVLIGLSLKLIWEATIGEISTTMSLIGSPILIEAHQWGVMYGIILLTIIVFLQKFSSFQLFKS